MIQKLTKKFKNYRSGLRSETSRNPGGHPGRTGHSASFLVGGQTDQTGAVSVQPLQLQLQPLRSCECRVGVPRGEWGNRDCQHRCKWCFCD